jgi:hypothetical protein
VKFSCTFVQIRGRLLKKEEAFKELQEFFKSVKNCSNGQRIREILSNL